MPTPLKLTYAGSTYLDRTRAFELGQVSPEGIELEINTLETGELFR